MVRRLRDGDRRVLRRIKKKKEVRKIEWKKGKERER
jgi:hypothetical protein